jgi:hypothetical protein
MSGIHYEVNTHSHHEFIPAHFIDNDKYNNNNDFIIGHTLLTSVAYNNLKYSGY